MGRTDALTGPTVGARALPGWFDMCQSGGMSNARVAPARGVAPCCPPLTSAELSESDAVRMAAMFRALSDPVRLRLFSRIAAHEGGEACVCEVADVGVSQPTVSHHLKKLRQAGLLTSERRGTWVFYRVEPSVLAAMGQMLSGT